MHFKSIFVLSLLVLFSVSACSSSGKSGSADGGDGDTDGDSDSDSDSDSDGDSDEDDYEIPGDIYYVSANTGDDGNPGTLDEPFETILHGLDVVQGGDGLFVMDGNYGDLVFGAQTDGQPIEEVFDDWVTIKAMDGHSPVLNNVTLGTWLQAGSSDQLPFDEVGNSDLRLRLDGFQVEDGAVIYGSRHVDVRNNVIQLQGDLIERIEDSGLAVFNGQHVKFFKNEVFHSGVGITAMTTDFIMRENEIHHCSHDGFKMYGGENWLIEGNVIHDLDDGLNDEQPGGMHVDGMHLHMIIHEGGYYHPRWAGGAYNFTFRRNFIYHTEAMGVMINECDSGIGEYENFVWENNVFGPTGGILFILGAAFYNGFVFRHNTVLYTPNDQWTSMWNREMGENFGYPSSMSYYVQVWGNPEGYEFYNNVFTSATTLTQDEGFIGSNIYYSGNDVNLGDPGWETAAPIHVEIPGLLQDFMDTGAVPGQPLPGSVAVDNGTTSQGTIGEDFLENPRDSAPDIGAIELQ